jgi:hypothetical protein
MDDELATRDEPTSQRGAALGIAGFTVAFFTLFPALLIVFLYLCITVYAVVKALGNASQDPSATVLFLLAIGVVVFLTILVTGGIYMIGRSSDPKRRR